MDRTLPGSILTTSLSVSRDLVIPFSPTNPITNPLGGLYWNTSNSKILGCDGTVWNEISTKLARTLNVANSGGDYTDINSAVAFASTLQPTTDNPVKIILSGNFIISSVINLTAGMVLMGPGAIVSKLSGPVISATNDSRVVGIKIKGDVGLSVTGNVRISECVFYDCNFGVVNNGNLVADGCYVISDTIATNTGYSGKGISWLNNCYSRSIGQPMNIGFAGNFIANNCHAISCYIGMLADAVTVNIQSGKILYCATSLQLQNAGIINMANTEIISLPNNLTTVPVEINFVTPDCKLFGSGKVQSNLTTHNPANQMAATFFSTTPGFESFMVKGMTLQVGDYITPNTAHFGTGDFTRDGMNVLQGDGSGKYSSINGNIQIDNGQGPPCFNNTNTGELVIGSIFAPIAGIRILGISDSNLPDVIVAEYNTPLGWIPTPYMTTETEYPYTHRSFEMFKTGAMTTRINPPLSWPMTVVFGINSYWMRFRLKSAVPSVPIIDSIRIKTHCTSIGKDGFIEYFGKAIPKLGFNLPINLDTKLLLDIPISWIFDLPGNIDTSQPIIFSMKFHTEGIGNIIFATSSNRIADDLIATRLFPQALSTEYLIKTSSPGKIITIKFFVDVSKYYRKDGIAFNLSRAKGDSFLGNITILSLSPNYSQWCNGYV